MTEAVFCTPTRRVSMGVLASADKLFADFDWFLQHRKMLRKDVYGRRCDRPSDTNGGTWNARIDAGEVLIYSPYPRRD